MKIRGVSEAIACYLGWDVADIRENRYHYGRTGTLQIFTVGEDYMTACKTGRKAPPKCHDNDYNFKWKLLYKDFFGFDIYYFNNIIDNE
ncbi:hypothetical protein V6380_13915 [Acinetobacter variabilis]|uniref:hypothetical protein n=1 Tax=Acinetobacter variabilis TaxID=70346 RepID=UPI003B83B584